MENSPDWAIGRGRRLDEGAKIRLLANLPPVSDNWLVRQPRRTRWFLWTFTVLYVLSCLAFAIARFADGQPTEGAFYLAVAAWGWWINWRTVNMGLQATSEGLLVRNMVSSKLITWPEFESVERYQRWKLLPAKGIALRRRDADLVGVEASMGFGILRARSSQIWDWQQRIEAARP